MKLALELKAAVEVVEALAEAQAAVAVAGAEVLEEARVVVAVEAGEVLAAAAEAAAVEAVVAVEAAASVPSPCPSENSRFLAVRLGRHKLLVAQDLAIHVETKLYLSFRRTVMT